MTIPKIKNKYSDFVAKIENGNTNIDYGQFRMSLLTSNQYLVIKRSTRVIDSLGFLMNKASEQGDLDNVIFFANRILSIDYTNLFSHKMLRQAYAYKGDSLKSSKYKNIEEGLINSIIKSGDGHTCSTGWRVIQVTEEYFIIQMLGYKVTNVDVNKTDLCDRYCTTGKEGEKEYFFRRISKKAK